MKPRRTIFGVGLTAWLVYFVMDTVAMVVLDEEAAYFLFTALLIVLVVIGDIVELKQYLQRLEQHLKETQK